MVSGNCACFVFYNDCNYVTETKCFMSIRKGNFNNSNDIY
jgi:hypothetical protein